ncbi:methyl-accepting chemotaxis protein [Spirulina sp. CCNP1310]|uniref:methyl-accepting chemotaxis protein n=1 Tax=Spirulina sp. CCNP1310 TaxID=3110249 RepID=UPI002B1E9BFB|nr:methyl-accepting chemotaxis protein [Spirulina sp. CCNP1310]MEA5419383.1 methyl-accepting chemotaxis protein [Spirulina sp. CCNP1310]
MLKTWKFRQKILLGYALPIMALFGASGFGWVTAQNILQAFKTIEQAEAILDKSNDIEVANMEMIKTVRGYLISPENSYLQEYEQAKQDFEVTMNMIRNDFELTTNQQEHLKEIERYTDEYQELADQMIALKQAGETEQVLSLFRLDSGRQLSKRFTELDQEFEAEIRSLISEYQRGATGILNLLIMGLLISALVLGTVAIALSLWITNNVSRTIQQATQAIAASSNEIAATTEQQERTASQQAASVNETTTTMDELGASSQQSAHQAEQATLTAQDVRQLADQGNQSAAQTLREMQALREQVGAIAIQISKLNDKANQIGSISQLVSDIANQTNLLALNAAVEAVRAGEQGKGFNVVATEIRKLADQSKQSASQINTLVADIQNAANSTVIVTHTGTQTVESSITITQATANTFVQVAEAINQIVMNNQQISLNVKQQAIATQQVADAMLTLNKGVQETAAGIRQTQVGTRQLNQAALDLQALV